MHLTRALSPPSSSSKFKVFVFFNNLLLLSNLITCIRLLLCLSIALYCQPPWIFPIIYVTYPIPLYQTTSSSTTSSLSLIPVHMIYFRLVWIPKIKKICKTHEILNHEWTTKIKFKQNLTVQLKIKRFKYNLDYVANFENDRTKRSNGCHPYHSSGNLTKYGMEKRKMSPFGLQRAVYKQSNLRILERK